jgi:hypothetical protein
MPISFVLALFVLPVGIVGVAVFLVQLSRRADRRAQGEDE